MFATRTLWAYDGNKFTFGNISRHVKNDKANRENIRHKFEELCDRRNQLYLCTSA